MNKNSIKLLKNKKKTIYYSFNNSISNLNQNSKSLSLPFKFSNLWAKII